MVLSHFTSAVLFGVFASVVFGITQRTSPRLMVRFAAFTFAALVGGTIAAAWIMWLIKR